MGTWKMTKKIGVIAEDDSDVEVITEFLAKYMDRNGFSVKKFVGNGCGKVKQKCDSWTQNLFSGGCEHVFLFHDLDRNKENKLRADLKKKVPPEKFPNSLIVIPIEELEGWLLSDANAIKQVFNLQKAPKEIHHCETIKSPKEHLEKLVWQAGKKRYVNTIHNKKLSSHTSLENLRRCESYKIFDSYVVERVCGINPHQ